MRWFVFVLVMVLGVASAHAEDKVKAQQAFAEIAISPPTRT